MPDDQADSGSAPPDRDAGARRVMDLLSEPESMRLLASERLGRLIYNGQYGPTALPVTYTVDEGSIVLGTWDQELFDEDLRTGIAHAEYHVGIEVDQIDVEERQGWLVLIQGAAHHLDTEAERAPFIDAGLEKVS